MKRNLLCLLFAFTFFGSAALLSACAPPVDNTEPDGNGHMHSLVHHVPLAATCETEGNIEYWSCAGCGKYFSDENAVNEIETAVIPATGHSWSEWETVYPVSCTSDGSESRTCSVCYAYETRTVAATGHDYSGGWKFDEQTHWQECKNCAEKKNAAAHSFSGDKCAVCDYTITYTENLDYELSGDGSYYIVSGRGGADDSFIFIPAQFGGKPVKSIGESAFENDDKLTGIYLPETVESVADYAFYGCSNLTSVKMQDGLKTIGVQAFKNCEELQDLEISGKLNAVGQRAFENCNALTNVYIRDIAAWCQIQFESQEANPLYYSNRLILNGETVTDLVIPDGVAAICNYAFNNCSSLQSVTIPNSVTSIGDSAFNYCRSLQSITIPNSVTSIGDAAFSYCTSLQNITIPDSVINIGAQAFSYCTSLINFSIPGNVSTIKFETFGDCNALRSVTISDGVTRIDSSAFYYCTSLQSINIPSSMTDIASGAFLGCSVLAEAYFADPDGWINTNGEIIPAEQLSDPQTAAELLKTDNSLEKLEK